MKAVGPRAQHDLHADRLPVEIKRVHPGVALRRQSGHHLAREYSVCGFAEQGGAFLALPAGRFQAQEIVHCDMKRLRLGDSLRFKRAFFGEPAPILAQFLSARARQRIFHVLLGVQPGDKHRTDEAP